MKKVINCTKDHNPHIDKRCRKVSVEEGQLIAAELFDILNKRKDGVGLAANQVGIDAAVAVVNVREPLVLINPEIEDAWDEINYYEGCLSYPGYNKNTKRFRNVIIKTAQSESGWYFSGTPSEGEHKGSWEEQQRSKSDNELRLLEAVCVQHEIDHLNGKTIFDRQVNLTVTSTKKIGRNEIVTIKKGDAVKVLKYKKAQKFLNDNWTLQQ